MKDYEEILKILHDNLTESLTQTGKKLVADVLKAQEILNKK